MSVTSEANVKVHFCTFASDVTDILGEQRELSNVSEANIASCFN